MDCVIVQDLFLNETAKFAHVFLPGTSFLEKDGTFINAERRINRVRKVMSPRQGKDEWQITQDLANAMGYPMRYASSSEIMDEIAELTPTFNNVSFRFLDEVGRAVEVGVARAGGDALASPELFVIINLLKRGTGTDANVPLRGVTRAAPEVREGFRIVEGRMFEWGLNEVVVGVGARMEFESLEVGSSIEVAREQWPVVGLFEADGGISETEIWVDAAVLQPAYRRGNSYQWV